jgi:hypothetical protein
MRTPIWERARAAISSPVISASSTDLVAGQQVHARQCGSPRKFSPLPNRATHVSKERSHPSVISTRSPTCPEKCGGSRNVIAGPFERSTGLSSRYSLPSATAAGP